MKRISFITIFVASLSVSLSIAAKESTPDYLPCQSTSATIDESNLSNEQKISKYTVLLNTHMMKIEKDTNAILCTYQQIFQLYRSTERDHEIKKLYEASNFLKTFVPTNENANNYAPTILSVVRAYLKLKEVVEFKKKIPNHEVRHFQKSADLLIHFCWNDKTQNGNLTGKLFEYISSRTPILSIGDQSEVRKLIKETHSGTICNNSNEIENFITEIINNELILEPLTNENCLYSKETQFKLLEKRLLKF